MAPDPELRGVIVTQSKREALHNIQQHRVVAQSLDTLDINRLSDGAIHDLYDEILRGERAIHASVTMVEGMKEVNQTMGDAAEDAERRADVEREEEGTATTPAQPAQPNGPAQTGGTAPLGAEGEPTAAEEADPNAATPEPAEETDPSK